MTSKPSKILTLERLAEFIAAQKAKGRRVVHCHGCFDLLHIGHIRHFKSARELGDVLVVTVTPDRFVNKGPDRPAFPEELRLEAIAALDMVDAVALNRWPTAVETIGLIKPDLYAKGMEYKNAANDVTGGIRLEQDAVEAVGGALAFTDDIVFSSSSLINRFASAYPKEVKEYLEGFARRHPAAAINQQLGRASDLSVLVVGEAIIDDYEYCEAIGKSSKEPTLAVKSLYSKRFAGGILAVANHVASFAGKVTLLTQVGDRDDHLEFIRGHVRGDIDAHYLKRRNSPTIVKKRLIEHYFFTKMLEVYSINDAALEPDDESAFCAELERLAPKHDVVLVADFGHSLMTPRAVQTLCKHARYLAVNTQANAGNMGYNVISKYPRADYISLAEKEMRLEARDYRGDLTPMITRLAEKLNCPRITVTRGSNGSMVYDRTTGLSHVPALAQKVVDRVGAGDASLSVCALMAAQGAPAEMMAFVGNVAGAWAVSIVGNEKSIDRVNLAKQIETLLK
jgi:rfaE bifunctional protein kinase chain/domain/rfaE bifunctional protein nucleotidyltransferase chain/domain